MKELISIIIPIYNAENFIEKCLNSITNQTYKNIEIILVNDGSTDSSREICDNWSNKDKRIKVIHKKNSGVSETRNIGIDNSTGNYITFVDIDDYIDRNMIEKLYSNIKEEKSDVAICGLIKINENKKIIYKSKEKKIIMNNQMEFLEELLKEKYFIGSLWGKLYRREIIGNFRLDKELRIAEDLDFLIRISENIRKVSNIGENLYYYYYNTKSTTKNSNYEKYSDELKVIEKNLNNKQLKKKTIESRYLRILLNMYYKYKKAEPQKVAYCKEKIKGFPATTGLSSYFSLKQKIKYILVKLNIV